MGRRDYFKLGDHNTICYVCGFKRKASEMMLRWDGVYVCKEDWETRQPQDFVRSAPEETAPEWTQPEPPDNFIDAGVNAPPLGNIIVGTPTIFFNGVAKVSGTDYTITLPVGQVTLFTIPAVGTLLQWSGVWKDNAEVSTTLTRFQFGIYTSLTNNFQIYGAT